MVEEAVGNVTSIIRRWWIGALDHQHAPLPQDEDEGRPYQFSAGGAAQQQRPWWLSWASSQAPPTGYGNYAPTLQDDDGEMRRDEQYSMDEAMRRSREERRGRGGDWEDDGGDYGRREGRRQETDEERERRELEIAMEISKREAEEKARNDAEAAAAAAAAAASVPDLINLEADLLGLGEGYSSASPGAGNQLVPFDPTANDAAIARTLNLLDLDASPSDSELLSKIEAAAPRAPVASSDVDLLDLVGGPAPSLDSLSGALVAINPNKLPFRLSSSELSTCPGCSRKVEHGRTLNALGRTWHPQCFKCKSCSSVIVDREFKTHEGSAYHDECHKRLFHPKCPVCNDYIAVGPGGLIEYNISSFWEETTCRSHATDGTLKCSSCHRHEPRAVPFVDLADGRKLCLECVDGVVVDSADCAPLFAGVQEFFRALGMPIAQEIPLLCVETQALNDAAAAEQSGHAGHSVTRGLCLSEEHTIQTVVRLPGSLGRLPFGGMGQKALELRRHCEVTAILVLYGLPRLLTGEILAHELMHAWMKLDGRFPQLAPAIEEGLCQVMAHLWLQSQLAALPPAAPGTPGAFEHKFAEFCLHQLAMDKSPVYGEGFRRAYSATVQHGLLHTLEVVRRTGQLP